MVKLMAALVVLTLFMVQMARAQPVWLPTVERPDQLLRQTPGADPALTQGLTERSGDP